MDYSGTPIDKEEQLKKLIEDTEEIIKNFRAISSIFAERANKQDSAMHNLGTRIVHEREKILDPSQNFGMNEINDIL